MPARVHTVALVAAHLALLGVACSNDTTPSPTSTTTTAAATTTVPPPTSSTTTTVAATPTTFTVSGVIIGSDTTRAVTSAEVEYIDGPFKGQKVQAPNGTFSLSGLPSGNYGVYVRAAGYDLLSTRVTVSGADSNIVFTLNKTITTTTTAPPGVGPLQADFFIEFGICTMTGNPATVNCTANAGSTTTSSFINSYQWVYLGLTEVGGPGHALTLSCGDGPEQVVNFNVTLNVTEFGGATSTITKFVTVTKSQGACGFN